MPAQLGSVLGASQLHLFCLFEKRIRIRHRRTTKLEYGGAAQRTAEKPFRSVVEETLRCGNQGEPRNWKEEHVASERHPTVLLWGIILTSVGWITKA